MLGKFRKVLAIAWFIGGIALLLQASPSAAQNTCKGLSQNQCGGSSSCTWVKGYKGKSGKAVNPYCRNKPSKSAAKKSSNSKAKSTTSKKATEKSATKKKASASNKSAAKKTKSTKRKAAKSKALPTKAKKADRKARAIKGKAAKKAPNKSKQ